MAYHYLIKNSSAVGPTAVWNAIEGVLKIRILNLADSVPYFQNTFFFSA